MEMTITVPAATGMRLPLLQTLTSKIQWLEVNDFQQQQKLMAALVAGVRCAGRGRKRLEDFERMCKR